MYLIPASPTSASHATCYWSTSRWPCCSGWWLHLLLDGQEKAASTSRELDRPTAIPLRSRWQTGQRAEIIVTCAPAGRHRRHVPFPVGRRSRARPPSGHRGHRSPPPPGCRRPPWSQPGCSSPPWPPASSWPASGSPPGSSAGAGRGAHRRPRPVQLLRHPPSHHRGRRPGRRARCPPPSRPGGGRPVHHLRPRRVLRPTSSTPWGRPISTSTPGYRAARATPP